jgi:hypothetical protein
MVAHAYNPSLSGGRDWEDLSSRPVWVESHQDPFSTNRLNMVVHVCNPNYTGSIDKRIKA